MPRASSKEPCDIRLHAPGDRLGGMKRGAMSWKPERDIEIVAGTPPGGGLDRSDASVYPTDMSRVPPHAEITPQRPDWLAALPKDKEMSREERLERLAHHELRHDTIGNLNAGYAGFQLRRRVKKTRCLLWETNFPCLCTNFPAEVSENPCSDA